MTYERPKAVQEFELIVQATDRDVEGKLKPETVKWAQLTLPAILHRFAPQAKPGMEIRVKITMEADL